MAAAENRKIPALSDGGAAQATDITVISRFPHGVGDNFRLPISAITDQAAQIAQSDFSDVATAEAASIPAPKQFTRLAGYAASGDGGGALYKRSASEPSHAGKFQSADGAWWEISEGPVSAKQGGAAADDDTDDAGAVSGILPVSNLIQFDPGAHVLVPGSTSPYYMSNLTENLVYRAVALTEDNKTLRGPSRLHLENRPAAIANDVQFSFATNKNMSVGEIKNLTFDQLWHDPENDGDASNSNQRFAYLVGVLGLRLLFPISQSLGDRRGYFANIQNSKDIQIFGHRHHKTTGGYNLRYNENVVLQGHLYYNFSEAIDFDGPNKRVIATQIVFESISRTNQCVDINDQKDGIFGDWIAFNTGTIDLVNYKTTTPGTYAEYVANDPVTEFQITENVIVSNVIGRQIGTTSLPSSYTGWDWSAASHAGSGPVDNVIRENYILHDASWIYVHEGTRLTFKAFRLKNIIVPASFYAVDLRSQTASADQISYSDLSGKIIDMEIDGSERGGIKIAGPSLFEVNGYRARNLNTSGTTDQALLINTLHVRGGVIKIDGIDVDAGVLLNGDSTAVANWAPDTAYVVNNIAKNGIYFYRCKTAGTSAGSGGPTTTGLAETDGTVVWECLGQKAYEIRWGANNRIKVPGALTFQGDVHKHIIGEHHSRSLGDFAATGTITRPLYVARQRCKVAYIEFTVSTTVAEDATNYRSFNTRSWKGGATDTSIASTTTAAGMTAFTPIDGAFAASEPGAELEPGDCLYLTSAIAASGKALTGVTADFEVIKY
jgi:hypothetical protein